MQSKRRCIALLRAKSFTVDGEAVVVGVDGVAVFDALHRRREATEASLYTRSICGPCPQCPQGEAGEALGAEAGAEIWRRGDARRYQLRTMGIA
jgi:hypothetical protein